MQLEFVPVEDFFFALTLAVRTLEEVEQPNLAIEVGAKLQLCLQSPWCDQSSQLSSVSGRLAR
jgi:hypothetical protein